MDIIAQYAFGESYHHLDDPNWRLDWKDGMMGTSANGVVLRAVSLDVPGD